MSAVIKREIRQDEIDAAIGKPRIRVSPDGTYTISGLTNAFFGPSQPLPPAAQSPEQGAIGRQFDYPFGYNLQYTPRSTELVGYSQLRALADNFDLLRLTLETRKDQIESQGWEIRSKKGERNPSGIEEIQALFEYPDGIHSYAEWQRALIEDMLVIDAATIYPRFTNGGKIYSFELVDGALIKPLIDATGRAPIAPEPAYQQIIKGLPAVDYSRDELVYRPRNVRTYKVYGYSPVEQIIFTVNIALRRNLFLMDYYTAGSIPDAFGHVPNEWTPSQIKEFQTYWDSLFENNSGGNSAVRRRMRWMAGDKVTFAKEAILKDEMDEWLARICCYALSVPPTPFIKQMNRATAETQADSAKTEGLVPLKKWWKSIMDLLLSKFCKRPDLEFAWQDEEAIDSFTQAQINQIYLQENVVQINEVREDLGLEALAEEDLPPKAPPPQFDAAGNPIAPKPAMNDPKALMDETKAGKDDPKQAQNETEKCANLGELNKAMESRGTMIQRQRLTRALKRTFRQQAKDIATKLATRLAKAAGDGDFSDDEWRDIFASIPAIVEDPLQRTSEDAVRSSMAMIPAAVSAGVALRDGFINDYALDYARTRGAEMVGMKWVDGKLVPNSSARWAITEETRTGVRQLVTTAIQDSWTIDKLTQELENAYAFSPARAELIARTETRLAHSLGEIAGWAESGVVSKKIWLTAEDDRVSADCVANGDQGAIDLDEPFSSGAEAPPNHPNCRCVISPVVNLGEL